MWWLAAVDFRRDAVVEWVRMESGDEPAGRRQRKQRGRAPAQWRQRGEAHFLLYEEVWDDGPGGEARRAQSWSTRTTLCIRPHEVTLVRFGDVRWNHTFRRGNRHQSTLYAGGVRFPIVIETRQLRVDVRPDGGKVRMIYWSEVAGVEQWVQLTIRFAPDRAAVPASPAPGAEFPNRVDS